jgi:predicted lipoprotein with Yx(FWY)xxD motif
MRLLAATLATLAVGLVSVAGATALAGSSGQTLSKVVAAKSSYGTVLFDGRGFVLYAFTKDAPGHSACARACAKAWPPYIVKGRLLAGKGVTGRRLGTIRRANGSRQATFAGRPLYYYVGDRKPGQILCQNVSEFGGLWLVVRPNGTVVR